MKVLENFWIKNVAAPALAMFIALMGSFGVAYYCEIKPTMEETQARFQSQRLADNIDSVRPYVSELEEEDDPAAKEKRESLEKIEKHNENFQRYYYAGEFGKALDEAYQGDKIGWEHFPDQWLIDPRAKEAPDGI